MSGNKPPQFGVPASGGAAPGGAAPGGAAPGGAQTSAGSDVGSKVASTAMRMARGATSTIMNASSKVNEFVAENHWSLKFLSLVGFAAVFGFSVAALAGYQLPTGLNSKYVMNIYMIFFSIANLVSEASDNWPIFGSFRQFMFGQFGFLKHNLGRGLYNIFFGLIFASLWPFPVAIVGVYVCCVGLLFMAAHRRGAPEPSDRHTELQEDLEAGNPSAAGSRSPTRNSR